MAREVLIVGAGRGGLKALETVLVRLPEDFPVPVIVAYHREPGEPDVRARLHALSPMPVQEVDDKAELAPQLIHLGPADYHVLLDEEHLALSTEAPILGARPSIDALFESAADTWRARVTAVLLGGAGEDGVRGLAAVKRRGGFAFAEDPATAEQPAVPAAAIAAGSADKVLSAVEIGHALLARLYPAALAPRVTTEEVA